MNPKFVAGSVLCVPNELGLGFFSFPFFLGKTQVLSLSKKSISRRRESPGCLSVLMKTGERAAGTGHRDDAGDERTDVCFLGSLAQSCLCLAAPPPYTPLSADLTHLTYGILHPPGEGSIVCVCLGHTVYFRVSLYVFRACSCLNV